MAVTKPGQFEPVLHAIHKKYLIPSKTETARNNSIVSNCLDRFLREMKKDALFARYYSNRVFRGGSQFDKLKVGSPDEYDLDILLRIPLEGEPILDHSNEPGFVWVEFDEPEALSEDFRRKFVDEDNHLCANKVHEWMISLVTRAANNFQVDGKFIIRSQCRIFKGWISTSGPAVTVHLDCTEFSISMDLVPCFVFSAEDWPSGGYRLNPVPSVQTFFIVPKMPKNQNPPERYWRLSFQEQERRLMHDKHYFKPVLRLMKMLRNQLDHVSIASYYLKTVFLLVDDTHGDLYWHGTMTNVFFKMLENYIQYIESGKIPYYWNNKNNLLKITLEEQTNIANRLRNIQRDLLENYRTDPFIICRYLNITVTIGN